VPVAAECCTCLPVCHFCTQHALRGSSVRDGDRTSGVEARPGPRDRSGSTQIRGTGPALRSTLPRPSLARSCVSQLVCSFGYAVNLPLGSRSADPHSTAVWCGNLLHSSPRSHTVVWFLPRFTRWSTRYCNQDLRQKTLQLGSLPTGLAISKALSTQRCSARNIPLPQRWWPVRVVYAFTDLGTIHFRSCALRQVSCYTFLSGFQPSWPPSCYP